MCGSRNPRWSTNEYGPDRFRPSVDARIDPPESRPYGDDFYEAVADTYQEVAWRSIKPAADIADASGVPVTTVHTILSQSDNAV